MIHENLGYGYYFDDETRTLVGLEQIKNYGFFSTFTLMFVAIINAYRETGILVENIDGKNLLNNLRNNEEMDMYSHFFRIDKDAKIDIKKEDILNPINPNHHHSIYQEEHLKIFKPFFDRYFNLSDRIFNLVENYKLKYNINLDNTLSVIYRETDKWTDFGGFNYVCPALYWRIAKRIKEENPSLDVLVQSENSGFVKIMSQSLRSKFIEETLLPQNPELPTFLTLEENKLEWADSYIASLFIHSKCKHLITYTGNSAFFVYLFRGTTKNMHLEITFTKTDEKEFFVYNA